MPWKELLACVTGSVNEELIKRNEYLAAENRILRNQIKGRVKLTNSERITLAKLGKALGRRGLEAVATIVTAAAVLGWHRKLVAKKFDGSKNRSYPGRPRIDAEAEGVVRNNVISFDLAVFFASPRKTNLAAVDV